MKLTFFKALSGSMRRTDLGLRLGAEIIWRLL